MSHMGVSLCAVSVSVKENPSIKTVEDREWKKQREEMGILVVSDKGKTLGFSICFPM